MVVVAQQRFDLRVRADTFRHGLEFMVFNICNPGPGGRIGNRAHYDARPTCLGEHIA
jgi:hypothetical protein